jgi:hypothetical protein
MEAMTLCNYLEYAKPVMKLGLDMGEATRLPSRAWYIGVSRITREKNTCFFLARIIMI